MRKLRKKLFYLCCIPALLGGGLLFHVMPGSNQAVSDKLSFFDREQEHLAQPPSDLQQHSRTTISSAAPADNSNEPIVKDQSNQASSPPPHPSEFQNAEEEVFTSAYTIEEREAIIKFRQPEKKYSREQIENALRQHSVWELSSSISTTLNLSDEEIQDGRVFVDASSLKFETLLEGDRFIVPIPHIEENLQLIVDKVIIKRNTLQWRGRILNPDGGNFIITKGGRFTTGSLRVAGSRYVFDINDHDHGWIHDVGKMHRHPPS